MTKHAALHLQVFASSVGLLLAKAELRIFMYSLKALVLTLISLHRTLYMPEAYVLLNCDFGVDDESIVNKLKELPEIVEVNGVSGAYDLLVKVSADTMEKLKETISLRIRTIDNIKSTLSLIVIEGQG
jgi:DNA-binding Lrp family transcriptional regulator